MKMAVKEFDRPLKPLIVDKKRRRFWVLVEKRDGTMRSVNVSAEYGDDSEEVTMFTDFDIAQRAAGYEMLNGGGAVEPIEVIVLAKEKGNNG
jgi:hypothetical protein